MADTDGEDETFLALVESNQKRMTKSPSETVIAESFKDKDGNTTRREACIGKEVAAVGELILILETEVNQLWDAWEVADQEVQTRLAELDGATHLPEGKNDRVKDTQDSLADAMKALGAEAEGIIEDSHEKARACEKVCLNLLARICSTSAHIIYRNMAGRYMAQCPPFCSNICWKTERG